MMTAWTIYDHPKDYPDYFVMRMFVITKSGTLAATSTVACAATLEQIRKLVPMGLIRFIRDESDDSCIVETWL